MKKLLYLWIYYVCFACLGLSCQEREVSHPSDPFADLLERQGDFSILITNAIIVDGSGKDRFEGDVLVHGDSIAFVGQVDTSKISFGQLIDAKGRVLSPGFIDAHSHGNPLSTPDFHNFLAMGVTTISLGQDGSSPATKDLNVWMKDVDAKGIGPNLAMYIGHGTLRRLSGIGFDDSPDSLAISRMTELLDQALSAGCFGLTTGLEYTPGLYASEEELQAVAKKVGAYDRIIMSHVRNEDDDQLNASIGELLRQGKHCKVQVSHIKSVYGKGQERANALIQLLDSARKEGIRVSADIYPYSASFTTIGIVFPSWARPPNNFARVVRQQRGALEAYLRERIAKRNGPGATLFGTKPYAGKTLEQVADAKQKAFEDVLIDDITPSGASAAYFVMNEELQDRLMQDSLTMICSDGSPTSRHPRGHGTFARIIETHVIKKGLFSLETAVRKMSALTAETIGLDKRGMIRAGYKADLLIFDPASVKETATYENPFQLAEGFDYVMVNGQIAKSGTTFSRDRFGKVLRAD